MIAPAGPVTTIAGMGRAVVVYNPIAGRAAAHSIASEVERRLGATGWGVRAIATRDRSGARAISHEVADDVDLLVAVGGDGTLREAIEGLGDARERVRLGFVPVGNANVAAQELGIPLEADAAIDLLANGEAVPIDLGVLHADGRSRLFLAMIGIGWDAVTVDRVDRARHTKPGAVCYRLWADGLYLVCGLLALFHRSPRALDIEVDGEPLPAGFRAIHVSNFRTYGKGMNVTPDAHHRSGRLHYQARRRVGWLALICHLLAAVLGRRAPAWVSTYGDAARVRISSSAAFPLQVDGDAHAPVRELVVEVLPGAAHIIAPKASGGPAAQRSSLDRGEDVAGLPLTG